MDAIIIEGPDCGGKTSLINSLFRDYKRIHNGVFPTSDEAMLAYSHQLNCMRENTIFDRMHLSELIYGKVMRDTVPEISLYGATEMLAAYRDSVIIVCLPPIEIAIASWKERKGIEYIKDEGKMREVHGLFECSAELTKLPLMFYDYTDAEFNVKNPLLARISNLRTRFYGN